MDLKIQPLSYEEQMTLAENLGSPNQSADWWRQTVTAAAVRSINGKRVIKPQTHQHVRRIIQQIGDEYQNVANEVFEYEPPEEAISVTTAPVTTLESWDLAEYAGRVYDIMPWRGIALLACGTRSLNGQDLNFPKNLKELKERVKELGWAGLKAAAESMTAEPLEDEDEAVTAGN